MQMPIEIGLLVVDLVFREGQSGSVHEAQDELVVLI